jgi:transposase
MAYRCKADLGSVTLDSSRHTVVVTSAGGSAEPPSADRPAGQPTSGPWITRWQTVLVGCVLVARDVCRNEAIRLGRRILALDADLQANYTALAAAVTDQAPDPVAVEQRPQC